MKDDPTIMIVIGDGIGRNMNIRHGTANIFKGPTAPQDAIRSLEEKFSEIRRVKRTRKEYRAQAAKGAEA